MNNSHLFAITALTLVLLGCGKPPKDAAQLSAGGYSELGRREMQYYGCASCHVIPGVPGAQGLIGPSLEHFANRNFIGGVLKNCPDNLVQWIEDSPAIDSRTAMPDLQIPEDQALNIACYLSTLQ